MYLLELSLVREEIPYSSFRFQTKSKLFFFSESEGVNLLKIDIFFEIDRPVTGKIDIWSID